MASTISAGTTSGTALNFAGDTTGTLAIQTGSTPTTAITVDASQNVTLNNVIPSGSTVPANGMFLPTTNSVGFSTASTERMRIDSSGNLLVGGTANPNSGKIASNVANSARFMSFVNNSNSAEIGYIQNNSGTAVIYSTSSDYRLKDNIAPMVGALDKVSALKPVTYTWKSTGENGQGFIAHELQEVCPEAVCGVKDEINEEGKPVYQGIDTSFLVATLTAAIQELNAKVDAQAAEIKALKGATE